MRRSRIADLSLLSVAMMWGCTFLIIQHAVFALPPLLFNAIRFIGSAIVLVIIIAIFYRKQVRHLSPRLMMDGLLLGLVLFAGYATQTVGLLYTTTSNAGFITGLSVVLVPFLSKLILRTQLNKLIWISTILAAAGLYLMTFHHGAISLNKGDILILLCAVAFALHIVLMGVISPRHEALPLATMQLGATGLFSLAASLLFEHTPLVQPLSQTLLRPDVLYALLISIGPTSAFAFWVQTAMQRYTTPARVAVIFTMEPVFAALTGVIFAGEALGLLGIVGCIAIFTGMILTELRPVATTVEESLPLPIPQIDSRIP